MSEKLYKRQVDLVKPTELLFPITIVGCGGIGSWTAYLLAKMGAYALTLVDPDKVEEHNVASQVYDSKDIGRDKVSVLQQIIVDIAQKTPIPFTGTFQKYVAAGLPIGRVVICAVDSLEERQKIWEIVRPSLGSIDLYIDGRMGGEQIRILCVSPFNADSVVKYQKRMENPTPADPTPCTARSIVYGTSTIGSFIASRVKRFAKRQPVDFDYMFSCETLERV